VLGLVLLLAAASPLPAASRQMVLSVGVAWDATGALLQAYERSSPEGPWIPVGAPIEASLGRTGLAWGRGLHPQGLTGPQKQEGDGRSPAGVFDLRLVTGHAKARPPGTRMPYREATATLRCVDDPRSAHYNRLADEAEERRDWSSAEDMRRGDGLYRLVVWVGHNDSRATSACHRAYFLPGRSTPSPTSPACASATSP
jgi:L,D-peptidoglycan transpeptidase YkuD (ErfK/YbiS/YcfS/YnhG family)